MALSARTDVGPVGAAVCWHISFVMTALPGAPGRVSPLVWPQLRHTPTQAPDHFHGSALPRPLAWGGPFSLAVPVAAQGSMGVSWRRGGGR